MREASARGDAIRWTCVLTACSLALNAETHTVAGSATLAIVSQLMASAQQRIPVPDADSQKASLKETRELFKADYAKAKRPGEHRGLIEKLQAQAAGASVTPIDRFVLLTEIESIAVGGGDIHPALEAIDQLAATFEIDAAERKLEALRKVSKGAKTVEQNKSIVEVTMGLLDEALDADEFDALEALCEIAQSASRRAKDKELAAQVNARTNEVDELRKSLKQVRGSLESLRNNPNDAEANRIVGKFRCFDQGNWKAGLPLLARGDDGALRSLAERDMAGPRTSAERLQLGEDWWKVADQHRGVPQARLQFHALDWYERALAQLTGLERTKVEKQIAAYEKTVAQHVLRAVPAGAVLLLTFDEATCHTLDGPLSVKDLASQRYRVEFKGAASLVPGKAGQALSLQGSYGRVDGAFFSGAAARTICAWAKVAQAEGHGVIFDSVPQFSATKEGVWEARADDGGGRVISNVSADTEWHHHCVVYDGAQMLYYVDGKPVAQKRLALRGAAGPIILGARASDAGYVQHMLIDDLAAFSRALNQREVQALYFAGVARRPLVK